MNNLSPDSNFYDVIDSFPFPVVIIKGDRFVGSNKHFRNGSGYSQEDLETSTIYDLIHKSNKDIADAIISSFHSESDIPQEILINFINKDDTISLNIVTIHKIKFSGENVLLLIGEDITQDPMKFQSSHLMQSLFESLSHHSLIGFWVDDLNNNTIYINDQLCEDLGYTYQEIKNRQISDFFHTKSQQLYQEMSNQRKNNKVPTSTYELILQNKNGKSIPYSVIGSNLYDTNNKIIGSVGMFTNIESIKKLSVMQSFLNKYVLQKEIKDHFSFWDSVRLDSEEILGAEFSLVFLDGKIITQKGDIFNNFNAEEMLEKMTQENRNVCCTCEKGISYFEDPVLSVIISVINIDDQPSGFIVLASEINQLFSLDDCDLFEAFCTQISLIFELHIVEKERDNEREFYSSILKLLTYDFVNANTTVQGYLELLQQNLSGVDIGKTDEYLQKCISVVERTERIIQTVLLLTKIQKEGFSKKTLLKPLIENAIDSQKKYHRSRAINVNLDCKLDLKVMGSDLIQEGIENIILNAILYTNENDVRIDILCQNVLIKDKKMIEIRFTDYGSGIPEDMKPILMAEIIKGDQRFKSSVGLGLSMAKAIFEFFDGKVWIENRVKDDYTKGTVVIIHLEEGD